MPLYNQGVLTPYPWLAFEPKTQFAIAQQLYPRRAPLMARLPTLPIKARTFNIVKSVFRPRKTQLTVNVAAGAVNDTLTLTFSDVSSLQMGDRLRLTSGEVVEVIADPNLAAGTVSVRRGTGTVATPTGAVTAAGATGVVWNLGNSRTGGEKFQSAIQQIPTATTQNIQTFQHIVQVSGIVQAMGSAYPLPQGVPTPYAQNKMHALQNMVDDIEVSTLLGVKDDLSATCQRPTQAGLLSLITTNVTTTPTNASAYKPTDFNRDTVSKIHDAGGEATLIVASSGLITGMAAWGYPLQSLDAGSTKFGIRIASYVSPFMGDIEIIESSWLHQFYPNSALVLSKEEVRYRVLEELAYKDYARVGDTGMNGEGDWIARMAVELDNEDHHAWVTGITGFAQQT